MMDYRPLRNFALSLALATSHILSTYAQFPPLGVPRSPVDSEAGVVNEAATVLQELTVGTAERIPEKLLEEAYAIAIIPHAMKGAFIVGLGGGRGVLVARDRSGNWQGPEFVTFAGGSVGWQVGVQSNDIVMVFRSPKSIENIRQGKLTLGANASVAAGPVGRYAGAATDTRMQAEILTYSRSRGLFAGVSLQGSTLQLDVPATQRFYQIGPNGGGTVPPNAQALVNEINRFSKPQTAAQELPQTPVASTTPSSGSETNISDPRIVKLGQDVATLQSKLDAQWQAYLALPSDWLNGKTITYADMQSVLIRYDRVNTNPQFEALRSAPDFQRVITDLKSLVEALKPASDKLALPPPPEAQSSSLNNSLR